MSTTPIVYVIDDDPEMRKSIALLLSSVAIEARTYESAEAFTVNARNLFNHRAMVLLDVRLPGTGGLALLERLREKHPWLPVVMITGYGDIDVAVRAMKLGAVDFITKPIASQRLLDLVHQVLSKYGTQTAVDESNRQAALRMETLTAREQEVFHRIVRGDSNKRIAVNLGISVRTVESHRASIMQKLNAKTPVELVRIAVILNGSLLQPSPS